MSGERSEFLPGPAWRTRARPAMVWTAIAVTFGLVVLAGSVLLWILIALLDYADASGWLVVLGWLALTAGVIVWALRTSTPASDDEDQAWSEYAVRAVMIGRNQPREAALRVITAVLFGAPLAVGVPILVALAAIGVS